MSEDQLELQKLKTIIDSMEEVVYVQDPDTYELIFLNKIGLDIWGEVIGQKCYESLQGLDNPCPFCTNELIFGEYLGRSYIWEFQNEVNQRWYRCIDRAIDWPDGRKVRYEMAVDITKQKEAETALRRKSEEILTLSTPVMQIWQGVMVAPLIGTLDQERTQYFMETFLTAITDTQSPVALIDITGVPTVDTQTAQHLIEAITAARLLGTQVILTGVSPAIAQTLVHLGIDLADFETKSSLADGLRLALNLVDLEVNPLGKT